jgi:hypothetical protein
MIFIIRTEAATPPPLEVKLVRQTPSLVPDSRGLRDFFCLGDPDAARATGWTVVAVHDGWYAGDGTDGMAIWGQGLFWEVRDTPFTIAQACGPEASPVNQDRDAETTVNVRQAIFRG